MNGAAETVRKLFITGMGEVYFKRQRCSLTISEELRCTYTFDREGRFMAGFLNGINYRRGLDNAILMKYFSADRLKTRRFLTEEARRALIDDVLSRVRRIRDDERLGAELHDIAEWMDIIAGGDFERLQAERKTFLSIFKPISILPPDQYLAVVLQAEEGCSWNRCTFCTLYRDRPFRIKSPTEFRRHAQQVKAFLGESLGLRHGDLPGRRQRIDHSTATTG